MASLASLDQIYIEISQLKASAQREKHDIKKCLCSNTEGYQFFKKLKSALKGLKLSRYLSGIHNTLHHNCPAWLLSDVHTTKERLSVKP